MAAVWEGMCDGMECPSKRMFNQNSPMFKIFKKAAGIFSKKANYSLYRKELAAAGTPCVPCVRLIEMDLWDHFEDESIVQWNFVNFVQCRKIAEIVSHVRGMQVRYSDLKYISAIQDWIKVTIEGSQEDKTTKFSILTKSASKSRLKKGAKTVRHLTSSFGSVGVNFTSSDPTPSELSPLTQRMTFEDMVRAMLRTNA